MWGVRSALVMIECILEHILPMESSQPLSVKPSNKKTATTLLTVCLIAAIVFIVSRYYLTPATNVTIIQSRVSEFDIKVLFDKDPIILEEKVVNPEEIIQAYFNYLYSFRFQLPPLPYPKWCYSKARYLVIHNAESLQIAHPSNKGNPAPNFVDIRLTPNQLVILPSMWLYKVKGGSLTALYDIPSVLLYPFV